MAKNSSENPGPSTENKGGLKKFLKSLSPARWSTPFHRKDNTSNKDEHDKAQARGISFDSSLANTGKAAAHLGSQEQRREGYQRDLSDTELANLERRRRRMSAQAQLGGLSPDTALSSHAVTTVERTEARGVQGSIRREPEETESIRTTRKAYRASRISGCVALTLMAENILSNAFTTADKSKMTGRGRFEKY